MADQRNIVQIGDPVLREKAVEVRRFDHKLHQLLDDMAYTMEEANGIGLAAPQVGISKRIAVIRWAEGLFELINPVITFAEGEEEDEERCLSIPDRGGLVKRFAHIKVKGQDRQGKEVEFEAEGYLARVFQHEMDHLEGRLFIDIMTKEVVDS